MVMSVTMWDLVPVRCRWIETLRHCGKTLLRRQRRLLRRIKKYYLNRSPGRELHMLMRAKVGGATPLVIACRNGHYDVAEYLIESCNADVEEPGSVIFDGETIEGAPPLWCAAAAGHMSVVRLLVKAKAKVNSTTRTHSTPLRAACFDGHYEIVKYLVENGADIEIANRHGHTCLMIACYKGHFRITKYLLSLKANVNRKSIKGNTALHDCAENGSLVIMKMLLAHGAKMDVDSYGMTPLLAASVTGHTSIVEYLISADQGLVNRQQRIDALELLGATYVDKRRDMVGALALWKRAMDDRFPADGSEPIPKSTNMRRIEAYDYAAEPSNVYELEELIDDPDNMRMQALLIRERILGTAHPDTSYYVRFRGAMYADAGRFRRCLQLWHHALDMQRSMLPPLSPLIQSSLYSFVELFYFMEAEQARPTLRGRIVPPILFEDIEPVFCKVIFEIRRGMQILESTPDMDKAQIHTNLMVISLHLATLLANMLDAEECTEETSKKIHKVIYNLVHLNIKDLRHRTPLHIACSAKCVLEQSGTSGALMSSLDEQQVGCTKLVDLMLRMGASPHAYDAFGNTPLHLVCKIKPCPGDIVRALLQHGAHIDYINFSRQTPEDILKLTGQSITAIVNPLKYTTLKCLAARIVNNHCISYSRILPKCLISTVVSH